MEKNEYESKPEKSNIKIKTNKQTKEEQNDTTIR